MLAVVPPGDLETMEIGRVQGNLQLTESGYELTLETRFSVTLALGDMMASSVQDLLVDGETMQG